MSGEQSTSADDASLDAYLKALACEHRRQLLYELKSSEERSLVVSEDTFESQHQSDAEKGYVENSHRHLPKLEELGLVDWDRDVGVVRRGAAFEKASQLLEIVETVEASEQ